jgi:hypothetical protein
MGLHYQPLLDRISIDLGVTVSRFHDFMVSRFHGVTVSLVSLLSSPSPEELEHADYQANRTTQVGN